MTSPNFFITIVVLVFAGMMWWALSNQTKMKEDLHSGCVKTDLRVYVGGRVGEVLTIYDCSGAPK